MDTKEFKDIIKTRAFVLADFYADWCEPCKILDDILEEVKEDLGEEIFIQKIDVDDSKKLSELYQIKSVPVLILFKEGKQVWRMNGFLTSNDLINVFRKFSE